MFPRAVLPLLALVVSAACSQWPMTSDLNAADSTNYHGFAPPVHSLRQVARTDRYTTFSHPLYPGYSARIKRLDDWCDEEVGCVNLKRARTRCDRFGRAYTGCGSLVERRHVLPLRRLIFLVELAAGPGSPSSLGLFMELGPCRITNATENPRPFKESWNANANIFINQPIGVEYSYADYGETVSLAEEGAVDIARFMVLFFGTFPQFKGRGFPP